MPGYLCQIFLCLALPCLLLKILSICHWGIIAERKIFIIRWQSPAQDYQLYAAIASQMDSAYLNFSQINSQYEIDLKYLLNDLFEVWAEKGLIKIDGDFLELTIAGQFWYINLTQTMIDYLEMLKKPDQAEIMVKAIAAQV